MAHKMNLALAGNLTHREAATVLHGLRLIQCEGRIEGCAAGDCEHFEDVKPLSNREIDKLAERINFDAGQELRRLLKQAKHALNEEECDSNDAEHDALFELVEFLEGR